MVKTLSWLLALPLITVSAVSGYAVPGAHDPSIIQSTNGTYYRFSTGGRIAVHTAPDITGPWKYQGAALPEGSSIELKGNDDLWAHGVAKVGDFYYLYYSVSSFGTQNSAIGVARSKSLDVGTWEDAGSTGVTSDSKEPYNAIDPNLIAADGGYYLTLGSYWQGIYQTHMRDPPVLSSYEPVEVNFTSNYEVLEGPFVFQHGEFYYLFMSKGKCCGYDKSNPAAGKEYRILVCRSSKATVSAVSGYAVPGAHDPSIIQSTNGTYYRFSTGGRIAVHTAPDITGPWKYQGAALPEGSSIELKGNDDLWAHGVAKVGDFYYLYYSVSSFGTQNSAIGVARSKSLDVGTWEDAGSTGVTSDSKEPYNAIDPNLIAADGGYYLTLGSYWQGIYQTHMRDPPVLSSYEPVEVNFTSNYEVLEGPFVFQHGEFYYLFMSKGKCCGYDKSNPAAGKEYRILVCRSSKATDGFVDKEGVDCTKDGGTVVLDPHDNVYGPGGQGVYNDPKHGPILDYHYVDTKVG